MAIFKCLYDRDYSLGTLEVLAERTVLGKKESLIHWGCTWRQASEVEGGEQHRKYENLKRRRAEREHMKRAG
jgi:hypothetical protein